MRFGGHLLKEWKDAREWAAAAGEAGYSAVYFPVDYREKTAVIDSYVSAAKEADLVICEVGAWNNLLDSDPVKREENFTYVVRQLELADYVGAGCCVNIAGSYSEQWDGPHPHNLTQAAFDEIVEITQRIVDAANPKNTAYTLEPMPWMYPDSADSYLALIKAVNRKGFAAHIDIVNILSSPQLCYRSGEVINEWFDKLGPYIRACHAKDIRLGGKLTVHLDECRPGTGIVDYETYIRRVDALEDKNVCLMLEHMSREEDYREASKYIKRIAVGAGIML